MSKPVMILRYAGSMWFGVVLMVLVLVAMAFATVFESTVGTEQALAWFYHSWWFEGLLALLAVNVLAAMVARFPFTRRQIGFVLTHLGIVVTLVGAMITQRWGIDGQLGIAEGQTVAQFGITGREVLTLSNRAGGAEQSIDLDTGGTASLTDRQLSGAALLTSGETTVTPLRYLPDSEPSWGVVNDNPRANPAIEVSFSPSGRDDATWVYTQKSAKVGDQIVAYRVIADAAEFAALLSGTAPTSNSSEGLLVLQLGEQAFDIPLANCMSQTARVGATGYSIRVLQYLPHATVGPESKIINASPRPENPYIEVEVTPPAGEKYIHKTFAKFPDFYKMHGGKERDLKVVFQGPSSARPTTPIELIEGPAGELHVRFSRDGRAFETHEVALGESIDTPWPQRKFTLLRRLDHARSQLEMVSVDPPRKARVPAVQVRIDAAEHTGEMWVRKHDPRQVNINGAPHVLSYSNLSLPLGFDVKLNQFEIVYYPGTRRPRSFESHITVEDPETGGTEDRLISMNNPFSYGGYTLYQSSYRMGQGRTISFLSIGRDPGQAVVFAGYFSTIAGMILVLGLRMNDRRKLQAAEAAMLTDTRSHIGSSGHAHATSAPPSQPRSPGHRARSNHGAKQRNKLSTKS